MAEALRVIAAMGDRSALAQRSSMPGIVLAHTDLDPLLVPRGVRRALEDEPWAVRHLHRVIPLQRWMPAEAGAVSAAAAELAAAAVGAGETYRVTVEKRSSALSSRSLTASTADAFEAAFAESAPPGAPAPRVSLGAPDRIILIEIFGAQAGVSVLSPGDILSVEREKRLLAGGEGGGPFD